MINPFAPIGRGILDMLAAIGRIPAFCGRAVAAAVSPPFFFGQFLRQCMQVGYFSLPVVGVTAVFIGAALLALFFAWRRIWRPAVTCQPGEACALPQVKTTYKALFWLVAALVAIALGFPYIAPWFY